MKAKHPIKSVVCLTGSKQGRLIMDLYTDMLGSKAPNKVKHECKGKAILLLWLCR